MPSPLRSSLVLLLATAACRTSPLPPASPADAVATDAGTGASASRAHRADVEPIPQCPDGEGSQLARAQRFYDAQQFESALACAVQAAAAEPERVDAQAERAAALVAVGRLEEARVAYARALALEPDNADALLGAADLYLNRLEATRDNEELALLYANRGYRGAQRAHDKKLAADFALLQAGAFNYLGRNADALARADEVLAVNPKDGSARHERAVALWELCRFEEARREFTRLVDDNEHAASAHQHLALLAERDGDLPGAEAHFAQARSLAPDDYPPPVDVPADEFADAVAKAVDELDDQTKRDLAGIPITTQDLPDVEDLKSGEPILSPEIIGLFRGPPLGEACTAEDECPGPCRSIVIYRLNLGRIARTREEFDKQVRQTLLHEVGHLRGEDDQQLVARGLE